MRGRSYFNDYTTDGCSLYFLTLVFERTAIIHNSNPSSMLVHIWNIEIRFSWLRIGNLILLQLTSYVFSHKVHNTGRTFTFDRMKVIVSADESQSVFHWLQNKGTENVLDYP